MGLHHVIPATQMINASKQQNVNGKRNIIITFVRLFKAINRHIMQKFTLLSQSVLEFCHRVNDLDLVVLSCG